MNVATTNHGHARKFTAAALGFVLLATTVITPVNSWAQSPEAREAFEEAEELLERERYSRAARAFEDVYEEYPDDDWAGQAMYWHAFSLYRLGDREDLEDARDALQRAIEIHGEDLARGEARDLLERVEGKLARRGDPDASRRIVDRAQDEGADEELRMSALNALMHMDSDRAVPLLERVLSQPDKYSPEMRAQAIFLLSQHGGLEFEDRMIEIVRNDPDYEVRGQAIFWLSQTESDRSLEILSELMETEEDEELQEGIVFAIAQQGSRRSAELLRDIAQDSNRSDEIRGHAIFWLGQSDDDNFSFLREMYAEADSPEMKEKIIFATSQQGGRAQAEFLREILRDESEDVEIRKNALFWLGQTGRLDLEDLQGVYNTLDDREMREQAIFVIAQSEERGAADILIKIIEEEPDPELRSNAVFWLGQIGDDRAMDLLEDIIEGDGQ